MNSFVSVPAESVWHDCMWSVASLMVWNWKNIKIVLDINKMKRHPLITIITKVTFEQQIVMEFFYMFIKKFRKYDLFTERTLFCFIYDVKMTRSTEVFWWSCKLLNWISFLISLPRWETPAICIRQESQLCWELLQSCRAEYSVVDPFSTEIISGVWTTSLSRNALA